MKTPNSTERPHTRSFSAAWRRWFGKRSGERDFEARAILATALDGIITIDERGLILTFNPAAELCFGYTAAEAIGQNVQMLMPPEFRGPHEQSLARYITTGERRIPSCRIEMTGLRKDGSTFPVELTINEIRVGRRRLFTESVRDLSERRQVEETLRENQRVLATLLANLPGMAYRCANDGRRTMLFASDGCQELIGHSPADMAAGGGMAYTQLIHPEDRDQVWNEIQSACRERWPYRVQYRIIAADGTHKWVWDQGQGVDSGDGPASTLEGIVTDVTGLKKTEEALRESEGRFRNMADQAPVMIWLSGPDRQCIFANKRWLEFSGKPLEAHLGRGWVDIVHPDDLGRVQEVTASAFDHWQPIEQEYRVRHARGDYRWIMVCATPRFAPDGQFAGYMGICLDITGRRESEANLHRQLGRLAGLYRVTDAGIRAGTTSGLDEIIMDELHKTLDASRSAILMFDDAGIMRFTAWRGLSDEYRQAVEGHSPWQPSEPDPKPIAVPDVRLEPSLASLLPVLTREKIGALAFIPLLFRGRLLGKFMLYYEQPHDFTLEAIQLAQTFAGHVAFAYEHRRSLDALRENEARLRLITEQIPTIIWTTDRELRFTSSLGAGLKSLDLRRNEAVGTTLFDFFQTADLEFEPIAAHRRALQGETVRYVVTWGGNDYESQVEPLCDGDSRIVGCIGVAHDVTRYRRAERTSGNPVRRERALESTGV
ncbi:MAG: PAS domain S-box protein [candidate division Zixibacteria bacterium]|nr:PAS domain S-box protein [candidate division Zixibacteria bacterium]